MFSQANNALCAQCNFWMNRNLVGGSIAAEQSLISSGKNRLVGGLLCVYLQISSDLELIKEAKRKKKLKHAEHNRFGHCRRTNRRSVL